MAIGDNIPSIFGNLVDSVMKSGGDPQYLMDQFAGENADRNLSLRSTEIGNAPPPFQGSAFDEAMMLTGDPLAATSMTIERSIAESDINGGVHSSNMDNAKIDMAATQMFDMFPGTIDQSLFSTVGDNMDVSADDLAQAWNDINTQVSTEISMMSPGGESLINPLPNAPMSPSIPQQNAPPPLEPFEQILPTGITPSPNPPMSPEEAAAIVQTIGEGGTPLTMEDVQSQVGGLDLNRWNPFSSIGNFLQEDIKETIAPINRIGETLSYENVGNVLSGIRDLRIPWGSPPAGGDQEIVNLQKDIASGNISTTEADKRIEDIALASLDTGALALYNQGDIGVANSVNRQIQTIKAEIENQSIIPVDDPGVFAVDTSEAERLTDGQPEYLQAGTPVAPPPVIPQQIGPAIPPPDGTGLSITDTGTGIGGTGGLIAGPGDVNANPVTGYTPYQQYPILMSGAVPNYYAPGMESAYDVGRLPTLGNFYLRPNTGPVAQDSREDFPSFFQATAPQDYNVLDWSEFSPQWNKIIDYVDAVRSGSPDAIENTRNEFIAGDYTALLKPLGIADSKDTSKNDAIALALSRYYAGQPVPSNYSTRAVANVLSSIYDNKQNEYLRKEPMAGSNMTTHFIGFLETVNPDRFGRN
tara:strand:- start:10 stop:1932 length:1923 start_codon:yes stop_codon:yes gene_type:complete